MVTATHKQSQALKLLLAQQEAKIVEIDSVIARTTQIAAARFVTSNKIGAELSVKQLCNYTAEKQQALNVISKLKEFDETLLAAAAGGRANRRGSLSAAEYDDKIRAILNAPPPTLSVDEVDRIREDAQNVKRHFPSAA